MGPGSRIQPEGDVSGRKTEWSKALAGLAIWVCVGTLGVSAESGSGLRADTPGLSIDGPPLELPSSETAPRPEERVHGFSELGALRADLRVRAFLQAYGSFVDSVMYRDDDVVFSLGGQAIHFEDGRMLHESRLSRRDRCTPLFYDYSLEPLTEPPPLTDLRPNYCNDVQEALWGRTENEIRSHGESVRFLDRRMFLNVRAIEALAEVERELVAVSVRDADVASWIENVDITYSFITRGIAGGSTKSQHSWGMAIDLVPTSYEGRQVYWRWSRVYDRTGWHHTPVEKRWTPPVAVIEIFERHGFVWGGKWVHFDNIHFEYRPEIIAYNRLLAEQ